VNPLTGLVQTIGSISALLGMGSSMTMQAANIHRQFNPPQQQAQVQQQCLPPSKLMVVVLADGTRHLACVQPQEAR
jgi:hypothetical protein